MPSLRVLFEAVEAVHKESGVWHGAIVWPGLEGAALEACAGRAECNMRESIAESEWTA